MTRRRQGLWWLVLVTGSAMLLAAVVLGLGAAGRADFGPAPDAGGPEDRQTQTSQTAFSAQAPEPGEPAVDRPAPEAGQDEPDSSAAPLVPVEARRPAAVETLAAQAPPAPVGLSIAAVDIAVDVVPVGVDDDGQMEIPESGLDIGWYRFGAVPGQQEGAAVLASHVDTLAEGRGVLARLTDLRAGDLVQVELADGSLVDYEVTTRRTVPKAELDSAELFDRGGPARLHLVTCGGPWQPERSSYRDNVIVTAEPVTG